jgi:hypothetical protein
MENEIAINFFCNQQLHAFRMDYKHIKTGQEGLPRLSDDLEEENSENRVSPSVARQGVARIG